MLVRVFAVAAVLAAGTLVPAATAQSPARATAGAAVVTGTLGTVAKVKASGDDSESRSAPSKTPDGIQLANGLVSVATSTSGDASATAQAEADGVELFDGFITAALVQRTAQDTGSGVKYHGSVRGLKIGDRTIDAVSSTKTYSFTGGTVTVNDGDKGMVVKLTGAVDDFEVGTEVVVADVTAHAVDGARPTPTATPTPTSTPTATATATPTPVPKPHKPAQPAYKKRLMGPQWVFPVRGKTTIGGPFGAARADTGFHEGNDLFANFGTPVVAVADGTVENVGSLPISGNRLWVYANTGDQFFYAHLSAFSPNAVDHARVKAGELLGYVGNTGDAEPTPPHLHFEIHPDGGKAVDPHPFLVVWQKRMGNATADSAERPGALVEVRDFIGEG